MKNLILLLAVMLVGIVSCDKNPSGPDADVRITDIASWSGCFVDDTLADHYAIRTQDEYDKVLKPMNNCEGNMPAADFSKRTLLGMKIVEKGGFAPNIVETVFKNSESKTYTYHIDIEPNDNLNNYTTRMHWITIPKIEDNFSVKFEVNYKAKDVPVDSHNPFKNKFWLSGEPYGMEKIVFKKGAPIYLNYTTKNTTQKTYRWSADNGEPFGEFVILHNFSGAMYTNRDPQQTPPQYGELKPNEELKDSWRVGNEAELQAGKWTAMAQAHYYFENTPNYPWEIEFIIEE